ncbi:hypothetical protein TrVGV298_004371 [Trichoderma virens]|nr:hypothetical protein TrVGV298_004371 [Trichoderma virens]
MISIALSQVQFVSALQWLLHFKIFDLVPECDPVSYEDLAKEANVPASELKRMLRMVMVHHIFRDYKGKCCHNYFSTVLAKDEDFLHGLPFFCNTVMPASAKIVDTTNKWQGSKEENEKPFLVFGTTKEQFLSQLDETNGYAHLTGLLGTSRSLTYSTDVVHGVINWSYLRKGLLLWISAHVAPVAGSWLSDSLTSSLKFMVLKTRSN